MWQPISAPMTLTYFIFCPFKVWQIITHKQTDAEAADQSPSNNPGCIELLSQEWDAEDTMTKIDAFSNTLAEEGGRKYARGQLDTGETDEGN